MTGPTAREMDQATQLDEAEAVAHQIEAVLQAAARMASPAGTPDFERAAWLHNIALGLSQKLVEVFAGKAAS